MRRGAEAVCIIVLRSASPWPLVSRHPACCCHASLGGCALPASNWLHRGSQSVPQCSGGCPLQVVLWRQRVKSAFPGRSAHARVCPPPCTRAAGCRWRRSRMVVTSSIHLSHLDTKPAWLAVLVAACMRECWLGAVMTWPQGRLAPDHFSHTTMPSCPSS